MYSKRNAFIEIIFSLLGFIVLITILSLYLEYTIFPPVNAGWVKNYRDLTVSSILTLWTIIVAALVYYLGRKDEKYYGFSGWQIITFGIKSWQKRYVAAILFIELIFTLLYIIIWSSAAVVLTIITLLALLLCTFYIVAVSTQSDYLSIQIKELLDAAVSEAAQNDTCRELMTLLRNLDYSKETDVDFLLDILEYCFYPGTGKTEKKKLRILSGSVRFALLSMSPDAAEIFIKNLLLKVNDIDFRTAVIFPVQELQEQDYALEAADMISVTGNTADYGTLLQRMIVCEIWLEGKSNIHWRQPYILEYLNLLGGKLLQQDINNMLDFYLRILAYQHDKPPVQSGLQRIMELQV